MRRVGNGRQTTRCHARRKPIRGILLVVIGKMLVRQ